LREFARDIGIPVFLQESRKICSVVEMATYYRNKLMSETDIERFFKDVERITTHEWVLYFAIYYSSWTGSMVLEKDKVFAEYD